MPEHADSRLPANPILLQHDQRRSSSDRKSGGQEGVGQHSHCALSDLMHLYASVWSTTSGLRDSIVRFPASLLM